MTQLLRALVRLLFAPFVLASKIVDAAWKFDRLLGFIVFVVLLPVWGPYIVVTAIAVAVFQSHRFVRRQMTYARSTKEQRDELMYLQFSVSCWRANSTVSAICIQRAVNRCIAAGVEAHDLRHFVPSHWPQVQHKIAT